ERGGGVPPSPRRPGWGGGGWGGGGSSFRSGDAPPHPRPLSPAAGERGGRRGVAAAQAPPAAATGPPAVSCGGRRFRSLQRGGVRKRGASTRTPKPMGNIPSTPPGPGSPPPRRGSFTPPALT